MAEISVQEKTTGRTGDLSPISEPKIATRLLSLDFARGLTMVLLTVESTELYSHLRPAAVILDYSRPGKPTDNPFIESFNGSFRYECLNMHWFLSLCDAYEKINAWISEYNHFRPHSSLNDQTPAEVVG